MSSPRTRQYFVSHIDFDHRIIARFSDYVELCYRGKINEFY